MLKTGKPRTSKGLAVLCARAADSKIAKDILIADLTKIDVAITDYFVICTADSENQIAAIAEEIIDNCRELGLQKPKPEGYGSSQWTLLDFFDVVVHIMSPEARNYYQLEKVWADAAFYKIDETGKPVRFKELQFY
ncbi:MAG: ribosome-associated protein [Bacteroidota bacterium]|nr:ribosome-associated protein [Bacteroidota bacterium]